MKTYISFGGTCEVAFQIRRVTRNEHAHFFDWLITPARAVQTVLGPFDESQFLGELSIVLNGLRVEDRYTGLQFQHDFPADEAHRVIENRIDSDVARIKEKYLSLRKRTLLAISAGAVFVRCECPHTDMRSAMSAFKQAFGGIEVGPSLFVIACETATPSYSGNEMICKLPSFSGDEVDRWKGSASGWGEIFKLTESVRCHGAPRRDAMTLQSAALGSSSKPP